jgi:uncharacterized small protein (DUF1192 family)
MQTKSAKQIAHDLGTTMHDVWFWRKKHGLADMGRSEAVKAGLARAFPNGRRGAEHPNWRGGRRVLPSGYVYIYVPDHPNATKAGCMMEHRLIAEQQIGRFLESSEVVHHLDGDKTNNDPSNLKVLQRGAHLSRHFDALPELAKLRQRIADLEAEIEQMRGELEHWRTTERA